MGAYLVGLKCYAMHRSRDWCAIPRSRTNVCRDCLRQKGELLLFRSYTLPTAYFLCTSFRPSPRLAPALVPLPPWPRAPVPPGRDHPSLVHPHPPSSPSRGEAIGVHPGARGGACGQGCILRSQERNPSIIPKTEGDINLVLSKQASYKATPTAVVYMYVAGQRLSPGPCG